jgi:hypothetical protein
MNVIPNHFQYIFVALGKVVSPKGGFIWDETTAIHIQIFSVSSFSEPKMELFVDMRASHISMKKIFPH